MMVVPKAGGFVCWAFHVERLPSGCEGIRPESLEGLPGMALIERARKVQSTWKQTVRSRVVICPICYA